MDTDDDYTTEDTDLDEDDHISEIDRIREPRRYKPFYFVAPEDDPKSLIEHFTFYFQENYGASPALFSGTLQEAVNAMLHPKSIADPRPLLIFIHHEKSIFARLFWSNILCQDDLIKYLRENYIVWPWDVTSKENSERLEKWWGEIFPDSQLASHGVEECPMLIGIIEYASWKFGTFSPFDLELMVLQPCALFPHTGEPSTLETLRTFKEEVCRHYECLVPFSFSSSTGLCPDILVEISKYLSLNEAINAFSMNILPFLRQAHSKIHLDDPSNRFLQIIPQHLDSRQVTSVRLTNDLLTLRDDFSSFRSFDQVISLILLNPQQLYALDRYLSDFPTVRAVSLWFDTEFDFHTLAKLTLPLSNSINRLQIRCAGTNCNHWDSGFQQRRYHVNHMITSFTFDSGHYLLPSGAHCSRNHPSCFLAMAVEFIQSLVNVRRVRFITNRFQIGIFLHVDSWQELIRVCFHLERVLVDVMDQGDYKREADNIEQQLRVERPGMIFRIKTV